uniref:Carbohydrate sulfotransferase n=1 Tax=Eptatretus burgeri TaxID=7764 RepID=A0A8C4QZW9_EPTBU
MLPQTSCSGYVDTHATQIMGVFQEGRRNGYLLRKGRKCSTKSALVLLPTIIIVFIIIVLSTSQLFTEDAALTETDTELRAQNQDMLDIQARRKAYIQAVCRKQTNNNIIANPSPEHVWRIYVEDNYGLLYCEVPKVACSNWKRTLIRLSGNISMKPEDMEHKFVHDKTQLPTLDTYSQSEIEWRLKNYFKFIFVREPFERFVSAFRDKFQHPHKYYHSVFGRWIIKAYRKNPSKKELNTNNITFPEFARFVIQNPLGPDTHWQQMNRICNPCQIQYDFIGHYETINEEANWLLRYVNIPTEVNFPKFKDIHSAESVTNEVLKKHYFSQLSSSVKAMLYKFYEVDFEMFNYRNTIPL